MNPAIPNQRRWIKKQVALFLFDTVSDVKSSSESSDDDAETRRKIAKISRYIEGTVKFYDDKQFKFHFRMTKVTAYMLVERYENSRFSAKHECGEPRISGEKSLLLAIWYLSNTETFRQICDRFKVSISSAHRVLIRVLDFIVSLKNEYIVWPNNERKKIIAQNFYSKQQIRNIIGAIDGSHVKINRPVEHEETYVNRKQYHSLIIQAIADHSKSFTDVCCGEPGSLHDARVSRRSSLYRRTQVHNYFGEYFLIGDSAYPGLDWIVTPFKDNGNLSENERIFNYRLSSTRMVIEHAFGLLKGRFRRLIYISNLDVHICVKIMMCCCILHNICISHKDDTEITAFNDKNACNNNSEPSLEPLMCIDGRSNAQRNKVFEEMFGKSC